MIPPAGEQPASMPEKTAELVETAKCPRCGQLNPVTAKACFANACRAPLKSELECLRTIDGSLRTIKGIAIWWLILSIAGVIVGLLYSFSR